MNAAHHTSHTLLYACQNGDGNIDFREVVLGLSMNGEHATDEKLRLAFNVCDENGDGTISREELSRVRPSCPRHILP